MLSNIQVFFINLYVDVIYEIFLCNLVSQYAIFI